MRKLAALLACLMWFAGCTAGTPVEGRASVSCRVSRVPGESVQYRVELAVRSGGDVVSSPVVLVRADAWAVARTDTADSAFSVGVRCSESEDGRIAVSVEAGESRGEPLWTAKGELLLRDGESATIRVD